MHGIWCKIMLKGFSFTYSLLFLLLTPLLSVSQTVEWSNQTKVRSKTFYSQKQKHHPQHAKLSDGAAESSASSDPTNLVRTSDQNPNRLNSIGYLTTVHKYHDSKQRCFDQEWAPNNHSVFSVGPRMGQYWQRR